MNIRTVGTSECEVRCAQYIITFPTQKKGFKQSIFEPNKHLFKLNKFVCFDEKLL